MRRRSRADGRRRRAGDRRPDRPGPPPSQADDRRPERRRPRGRGGPGDGLRLRARGRTSRIGYPEVRRGLVAAIVMHDLIRQVGDRRARYLLLRASRSTRPRPSAGGCQPRSCRRIVPRRGARAGTFAAGCGPHGPRDDQAPARRGQRPALDLEARRPSRRRSASPTRPRRDAGLPRETSAALGRSRQGLAGSTRPAVAIGRRHDRGGGRSMTRHGRDCPAWVADQTVGGVLRRRPRVMPDQRRPGLPGSGAALVVARARPAGGSRSRPA